jgi:uncharacterized protein (TIGR03083 family)
MAFPGEADLRAERHAVIATMESLTDDEFESGPTLCAEWAPRDILAHLMGIDSGMLEYVKAPGQIRKANQAIVDKARPMSRDRLMNRARHWADKVAPLTRATALFYLGDTSVHHQDVLRGLGRTRDVPDAARAAILREGVVLGSKKLLSFRVEPTDGGRAMGRGTVVRGTSEALGLWLTGRAGIEPELEFQD